MLSELLRRNEVLGWVAIGHAFLFAMALALWLVDDRQLGGVNVWIKPMKFALSVALYTATFGWIYYYAEASPGAKAAVSWVITLTLVYEIVCVLGQAWGGVVLQYQHIV